MKFKNLCLLLLFVISILNSCKKNTDIYSDADELTDKDPGTIVLQRRPSSEPFLLSNKSTNKAFLKKQLPADPLDIRYYLGRSYNTDISEIGSPDGVKFPIIDIDGLISDMPSYYLSKNLRTANASAFSFLGFDRYQEKSNSSDKISGGFSLNLGFFKIGSKHNYENVFSKEIVNENKRVFGELNVEIKDASFELLTSSNVVNKIKEKYLDSTFLDELYNTSNSEFLNNYGGFVVTNFIAGGKALAIFSGLYTATSDSETTEKSMDNSINASFTFSDKDSNGLDLGIGNSNGSVIARNNNISEFTTAVKTYGGNYGFGSFTTPKNIDDVNVDFGGWLTSLNDKTTHTLIGFNQGGLHPVTDFILEDNFRHNIKGNLEESILKENLEEPCFAAMWDYRSGGAPVESVAVVLITRFGDELEISGDLTNSPSRQIPIEDSVGMLRIAKENLGNRTSFYKLKIVAKFNVSKYGFHKDNSRYKKSIRKIDEAHMKKYYDPQYHNLYLLSDLNGEKFAYSIHDDYILDTYGIRDWVNGMASKQITNSELQEYTIVGL